MFTFVFSDIYMYVVTRAGRSYWQNLYALIAVIYFFTCILLIYLLHWMVSLIWLIVAFSKLAVSILVLRPYHFTLLLVFFVWPVSPLY